MRVCVARDLDRLPAVVAAGQRLSNRSSIYAARRLRLRLRFAAARMNAKSKALRSRPL
jgi:hypothetical protein